MILCSSCSGRSDDHSSTQASNNSTARTKSTPCLRRFDSRFTGSHSNPGAKGKIVGVYTIRQYNMASFMMEQWVGVSVTELSARETQSTQPAGLAVSLALLAARGRGGCTVSRSQSNTATDFTRASTCRPGSSSRRVRDLRVMRARSTESGDASRPRRTRQSDGERSAISRTVTSSSLKMLLPSWGSSPMLTSRPFT
jgi:hypothetical protein